MSTSFWITPIDTEAKDRFKQAKVKLPRRLPASRAPTPAELRDVLDSLEDYVAEFTPEKPKTGEGWYIGVRSRRKPKSGPGLFIAMSPLKSAAKPVPLVHVESGHLEVAALVAVELAKVCGPQLLDGEDSYGPHLVDGGLSASELAQAMEAYAAEESDDYPAEFGG
jgi:hypothetical protein